MSVSSRIRDRVRTKACTRLLRQTFCSVTPCTKERTLPYVGQRRTVLGTSLVLTPVKPPCSPMQRYSYDNSYALNDQIMIRPSSSVEMSFRASGLNLMDRTVPLCPKASARNWHAGNSHSRIAWSDPAVARSAPLQNERTLFENLHFSR